MYIITKIKKNWKIEKKMLFLYKEKKDMNKKLKIGALVYIKQKTKLLYWAEPSRVLFYLWCGGGGVIIQNIRNRINEIKNYGG